jgi:D-alanine-D-alanine ligase
VRVLILHSDVPPDAPADEQDTLYTAEAVREALVGRGHQAEMAAFAPRPDHLRALLDRSKPNSVFNLVEAVWGLGQFAIVAAQLLEMAGVPFTGTPGGAMALAGDKPLTKSFLRTLGLPTADWSVGPEWKGLEASRQYVVKHATEDASIGLDDASVVSGREVPARAAESAKRWGGRWFAEAYLPGREFNVSAIEVDGRPLVLPVPEMRFHNWEAGRVRIVGYAAKWDEDSSDLDNTRRDFALAPGDASLAEELRGLVEQCWIRFGMRGFARVDFRLDENGRPTILELNPNPCLEPGAGLAAAAREIGLDYAALVETILNAACRS